MALLLFCHVEPLVSEKHGMPTYQKKELQLQAEDYFVNNIPGRPIPHMAKK